MGQLSRAQDAVTDAIKNGTDVPWDELYATMKRYIATALDEEYASQRAVIAECRGPDSVPARLMLAWCEDTNARVLGE